MADHLSDEEQLEALKKWWHKYGTGLLLALVVTLGGWFGWNSWQERKLEQAEQASVVYMAMVDSLSRWEQEGSEDSATTLANHGETLKQLGGDSRYAQLAALTIARVAAADGDFDTAASELEWVLAAADEEALRALVKLRLAAVEQARDNSDRALELLAEPYPDAFAPLYLELKGDIFAARGDSDDARAAFQGALDLISPNEARSRALLELKLNDVMSAPSEDAGIGEEDA